MRFKLMLPLFLFVVGCAQMKARPVMNFEHQSIPSGITPERFEQALGSYPAEKGWVFERVDAGHYVGTLQVRTFLAVVDLYRSETEYAIRYRDSAGLLYDGTRIHRNYNRWVNNLNSDIHRGLALTRLQ